jgi:hypothetical protein
MSIQEFHSQLTQVDPPDSIIAILGRLTVIDGALLAKDIPQDGWYPWASGVSS